MTLKVVCGYGHISEYNLTLVPKFIIVGIGEEARKMPFTWDLWRCKQATCTGSYINHVVDDDYNLSHEEVSHG